MDNKAKEFEEIAMQTTDSATTESAIWGRLLATSTALSPKAARVVLKIDFPQADKPEHGVRKQCGVTGGRYGHFPQPDFWVLS